MNFAPMMGLVLPGWESYFNTLLLYNKAEISVNINCMGVLQVAQKEDEE
jgi:hypothetical protein